MVDRSITNVTNILQLDFYRKIFNAHLIGNFYSRSRPPKNINTYCTRVTTAAKAATT